MRPAGAWLEAVDKWPTLLRRGFMCHRSWFDTLLEAHQGPDSEGKTPMTPDHVCLPLAAELVATLLNTQTLTVATYGTLFFRSVFLLSSLFFFPLFLHLGLL